MKVFRAIGKGKGKTVVSVQFATKKDVLHFIDTNTRKATIWQIITEEGIPSDYEECGYCGFDHSYNYVEAKKWHEKNDPEGRLYK